MQSEEPKSYRFGTVEHSGIIGQLRASQVVVLGAAGAVAVALLIGFGRAHSGLALLGSLVLGVLATGVCFVPLTGRCADEWLPVLVRYLLGRRVGRHVWRSGRPYRGRTIPADGASPVEALELPPQLEGVSVIALDVGVGELAVVKDEAEQTYTGVLAVSVGPFTLLDGREQEMRLASWGSVLAGLAREGSPVSRLGWVERSVPSDGDEIGRYLAEHRDSTLQLASASLSSYLELVDSATAVSHEHEVFLALQISRRKASRAIRQLGGGDEAACQILRRELQSLSEGLRRADATAQVLRPGALAKLLRVAYDPFAAASLARAGAHDAGSEADAIRLEEAGPLYASDGWRYYRTDSALHATYWVSGWPRLEVPATFMAPFLAEARAVRSVAMVIEPVPLLRATREAEAARTSAMADEDLRHRHGRVTSSKRRREQEAVVRHEAELSHGHAKLRYTAYATTSARSERELELCCDRLEQAALRSHLQLRAMYGQQAAAMTFTLPLCRGLR